MQFDFSLKKIATTSTWVFDLPFSSQSMNLQHLFHHHSTSRQIRSCLVRSSSIFLIQPFFRRTNSIGYVFFVSLISRVQVRFSHRCRSFSSSEYSILVLLSVSNGRFFLDGRFLNVSLRFFCYTSDKQTKIGILTII